jgi:aminopeptidase
MFRRYFTLPITIIRHYSTSLQTSATTYIQNILRNSLQFNPQHNKLLLLYDTRCELSKLLSNAYKKSVSKEMIILVDFDQNSPEIIKETINKDLKEGDLVVCIQTAAFYLNDYRLRLELFARNLKNIEHVHLGLMPPEQHETYIESLSFDHSSEMNSKLAHYIKNKMDNASRFIVTSGKPGHTTQLIYDTPMESSLLNIGDYTNMKNVGGTFPVGEVFSEPQHLDKINGKVMVFGFPNIERIVEIHDEPFMLTIENGVVTDISKNAPKSFLQVFNIIKENEGHVIVREFGIGINPGMGRNKPLNDVTAFERQKGLHLSLGKKHTVFKKPQFKSKNTKFHIDMFVDVRTIQMDDHIIYDEGEFK